VFEGYLYSCSQKREALKQALAMFSQDTYRVLVFHLEDRYKLIIEGSPCSAISDIEDALNEIAGPAADLIISRIHSFLRATKPGAASYATQ
jgi:hypothetical protein